ncbi:MAG: ABC transporter permease [Bacteroidaceae bacterium]|nr:ABC transporter permease [Bacteroidaceae bacterium]
MKKLTYSAMALARLRANKRQYLSLVIGVFLAVFLVTVIFLAAQGYLLAKLAETEKRVGKMDSFLLDAGDTTDQQLLDSGLYSELGRVNITAALEGTDTYLGWYDEIAAEHMNRSFVEGRQPEKPGEIAVEQGTLLVLDLERDWMIGDTLELSLTPIDGTTETRKFTLVGILVDQVEELEFTQSVQFSKEAIRKFPALLVSSQEPTFQTGRVAVHRTLIRPMGKFASNGISTFTEHFSDIAYYLGQFCTISVAGMVNFSDNAVNTDSAFVTILILGAMLALALIASCCIGIAGAMEGALTRRREEIGLLRVVGATKRQIRRIFGRESLILALAVSPFSIVVGILAVWFISIWIPEQMILKLNPLLLIPIAILSMAVILFAGYWPLRRFSSQMPMSVIRDTEILRRITNAKSKKNFKVSKLISNRMLRLYPGRQIGSGILTALMLFCAICAVVCMSFGLEIGSGDNGAFSVTLQNSTLNPYVAYLPSKPLSDQSLVQLRKLPHVEKVVVRRDLSVQVLLDQKYDYIKHDNPVFYTEEEYLSRQEIAGEQNPQYIDLLHGNWESQVTEYNAIRKYLGVEQEITQMEICTVILDQATLQKLSADLVGGKIDVDAINAGREVIVSAPSLWQGVSPQGYGYTYRSAKQQNPQDILVTENDCFHAGMELPIIQLWSEDEISDMQEAVSRAQRKDATVRVGAVVSQYIGASWFYSTATILTTEQGLRNMGLYMNGYDEYEIYLDGDIDLQTEEILVQKINAIASRSGEYYFYNDLEAYRENLATGTQLVAVFSVISILFAAVSVSMIVSSITRRIQSDGKRIGMLRAVGADQKTILDCYTGQMTVSILGGWVVTMVALGVILLSGIIEGLELYAGIGVAVMSAMAIGSWLICWSVLRLRIHEIVNRSIIENIREL